MMTQQSTKLETGQRVKIVDVAEDAMQYLQQRKGEVGMITGFGLARQDDSKIFWIVTFDDGIAYSFYEDEISRL